MRIESLLAAVLSISLGALGQLFLKIGAGRLAAMERTGGLFGLIQDFIVTWQLSLGLVFYGTSAFVWIYVLSVLNLSVAYPLVGMSFIVVMLLSVFVLGETVTLVQVAGCAVILTGIMMVTRG